MITKPLITAVLGLVLFVIGFAAYILQLQYIAHQGLRQKWPALPTENRRLPQTKDIENQELYARRKRWNGMTLLSSSRPRIHRLPDVIGIGIQKCGTGAFIHFLTHHPYMKVLLGEAKFYGREIQQNGLEYYKKLLPAASEREILMEKTPSYFNSKPANLPRLMHKDMPGLKVIVILCNPVQRALSGFAMAKEKSLDSRRETFDSLVNRTFEKLRKIRGKNEDAVHLSGMGRIFNEGVYALGIKRWIKEFKDSLLVLNGENFLQDPGSVMEEVQKFLGIPVILQRKDFVRRPDTGMFCVRPWWDEDYDFAAEKAKSSDWFKNLICMSPKKGRSRSKVAKYTMSNETARTLREFYRPYNELLYSTLGRNFGWN